MTDDIKQDEAKNRTALAIPAERCVIWHKPSGEVPASDVLLVEVDLANGESDVALVTIADYDCNTLIHADDFGDVWTAWAWEDVSRYAFLDEILIAK